MASWTSEYSTVLSLLLDEVVGTKEMIDIRVDYCKIADCLLSLGNDDSVYYTGSKSEGLDLPGSDSDFMYDMNNREKVKVIQSLDQNIGTSPCDVLLYMSTENVPLGFAILYKVDYTPMSLFPYKLGLEYLNGDRFLQDKLLQERSSRMTQAAKRQGPSIETWLQGHSLIESGTDMVHSIHCAFWPNVATEWLQRPRYYQWPFSHDILSITDFGCHISCFYRSSVLRDKIARMANIIFYSRTYTSLVIQSCSNAMLCSYENYTKRIHQGEM